MAGLPRSTSVLVAGILLLASCSDTPPSTSQSPTTIEPATSTSSSEATTATTIAASLPVATESENVLLIILDDLGVDSADCYAPEADAAPMQRVAQLCAEGLVFDSVWSNPVCSPTRATMLTGKYGFRTGIGQPIAMTDVGLRLDETTLPMMLSSAGIPSANIGKWHLSGTDVGDRSLDHPNLAGYSHYAGSPTGALRDYESWRRVENGVAGRSSVYATTAVVDDALAWIETQDSRWFTWVAFNAPHTPFHLPPADLHSHSDLSGEASDIEAHPREYFEAMVEALDTEIERLLDSIDPAVLAATTVIIVGDNGTDARVANDLSRARAKGSIYQGGIHVPMVVWGSAVSTAGRSEALINLVDIFPTVLDLMGIPHTEVIDGVSFAEVLQGGPGDRAVLFSELFGTDQPADQAGTTVSDGRWQYLLFDDGTEELFDLVSDPTESTNLLETPGVAGAAALAQLRTHLESITSG
jgi:arylsulfatase A-like enzyme